MERFQYSVLIWTSKEEGPGILDQLDELGSEGWEAVGITTRSTALPMPGMGGSMGSDVIVLLKRRLPTVATEPDRPPRRRQLRADESGA